MKHKIEFIYREQIRQPEDRYLPPKLREACPFTLLNAQVRLSWCGDVSGPVQVEIGALCAEAMTFAFHKGGLWWQPRRLRRHVPSRGALDQGV